MAYQFFSHNGKLLPSTEAVVPLDSVEYAYGFGVYETIRVNKGVIYFLADHAQRLLNSAHSIELEHQWETAFIEQSVRELVAKNESTDCNVKILLIGGRTAAEAQLYIQCLNPLFPDRKLYKNGAHTITVSMERPYPQAKTLNMLPSYLAYRQARQTEAYDALLINRDGNITEGTRTNFYVIKDRTIISPPAAEILPGVTQHNVLKVAQDHGFALDESSIPLSSLQQYDGAFLTSTSSKIMPLRSINDHTWDVISPELLKLMAAYAQFLDDYTAEQMS